MGSPCPAADSEPATAVGFAPDNSGSSPALLMHPGRPDMSEPLDGSRPTLTAVTAPAAQDETPQPSDTCAKIVRPLRSSDGGPLWSDCPGRRDPRPPSGIAQPQRESKCKLRPELLSWAFRKLLFPPQSPSNPEPRLKALPLQAQKLGAAPARWGPDGPQGYHQADAM